jgi:hypothetical protein
MGPPDRARLNARGTLGKGLPWLVLTVGLVLATLPAWRPLVFGAETTVDDLLAIRCLPW